MLVIWLIDNVSNVFQMPNSKMLAHELWNWINRDWQGTPVNPKKGRTRKLGGSLGSLKIAWEL